MIEAIVDFLVFPFGYFVFYSITVGMLRIGFDAYSRNYNQNDIVVLALGWPFILPCIILVALATGFETVFDCIKREFKFK